MNQESINISELVFSAINNLFSNLFNSIDNNIFPILDRITFIDDNIFNNNFISNIIDYSYLHSIISICNSLIIGFIIFYSINYFISHFSYHSVEKPQSFIFKIIILAVLSNYAFDICKSIIYINSLISSCIQEIGYSIFNININFSSLINSIDNNIYNISNSNIFSIDGILKSFTSIGLINLIFTYSLRYIMIKVFILLSPFAIITLSTNSTSWIFKNWLKSFISLLILQIFISIILLITFSININSNDLFNKILFIGSIYALIQANSFIKEIFGGITTTVSSNISNFKNLFY